MTDQLIPVSAAAIVRHGAIGLEIFTARRAPEENFPGGWEFPGGKQELDENAIQAVHREIDEELNVKIHVITQVEGPLPDGTWPMADKYALTIFISQLIAGAVITLEKQHDDMKWLPLDQAETVGWVEADIEPLRAAIAWLRANPQEIS